RRISAALLTFDVTAGLILCSEHITLSGRSRMVSHCVLERPGIEAPQRTSITSCAGAIKGACHLFVLLLRPMQRPPRRFGPFGKLLRRSVAAPQLSTGQDGRTYCGGRRK